MILPVNAIFIGDRRVCTDEPVFVIAEAGVNHNGKLNRALKLVDAAVAAGADGVKFQLYRAEEQASKAAETAEYQKKTTGSKKLLDLAQSYDLPWEEHHTIAQHCRDAGIIYMASCFDTRAVDFLLGLGGECIKVGSGEITNYPLLAYMAGTGKPILLSTGMCTLQDVSDALAQIHENGDSPVLLFQCSSSYPADPASVNLRAMSLMARQFDVPVGFSDHTTGIIASVAAVAMGASMIEKHFTLDKNLPGPDHAMSLNPEELREFVAAVRTAQAALGDGVKQPHPSEIETRTVARRSLVSARPIKAGSKLAEDDVTLKRPATGIDPRMWDAVRGRTVVVDIPEDVPITWEMLE